MYLDVTLFDKLILSQFYWLEIEEFDKQLSDVQYISIWNQKLIETRKKLELCYSKKGSNESLETWNSIPDTFNCLKKLTHAIISTFSSTHACESLFSENNILKPRLETVLRMTPIQHAFY
ncbi:dimer_Tnp_hAT domain-containing protein [Trichonephila clavipes]|nr:dimer_Tnp_hAT domain-containing protein [Trichonephila clavipes]